MATEFSNLSDDDVALMCKQGNEAALYELYGRYKQRVINFAYQMLRDRDAAADVLQETFLYFFSRIPRYRAEGKLHILLLRAARNRCLNRLKKIRKVRMLPLDEVAAVEQDSSEGPVRSLEAKELREGIAAALERIPPPHSEVIVLRILGGLSYSEIGEIVGCPEGTVKSRLHNGLELLRKSVKEKGFA